MSIGKSENGGQVARADRIQWDHDPRGQRLQSSLLEFDTETAHSVERVLVPESQPGQSGLAPLSIQAILDAVDVLQKG